MTLAELQKKLDELLRLPAETDWVEFKRNKDEWVEIGEYLSAIANGAVMLGKPIGNIVWGIEDDTLLVLRTSYELKRAKVGNEALEKWLLGLLNPRIDFTIYEFEHGVTGRLFEIQAANSRSARHFVTNRLQELQRGHVVRTYGATGAAKWRLHKSDVDGEN